MSRIGKKPVDIPDGVKVALKENTLFGEGPSGKNSVKVLNFVRVKIDDKAKKISFEPTHKIEQARMNHGTMRALAQNMIVGVSKGFEKQLRISGVGYSAKLAGDKLVLTLGFSHPVEMPIPGALKVTVPDPSLVVVKGADRYLVGQFSAEVRSKRVVEPYNLKGIKYENEIVKKKAGKTFVSGA